jgi:hypothetical protein
MTDEAGQDLDAAVALALAACRAYGRTDLANRLEELHARANRPEVNAVVVGEFKQGKSSLINALLDATVCPVDDDLATAVPTLIRHGAAGAQLVVRSADDPTGEPERRPIPLEEVARYATEAGVDSVAGLVLGVEIDLERRLLEHGLVVVDTPGTGGLGSAHATASLGVLSVAHLAVFVTDASQELTAAELGFLRQAAELCPRVLLVVTKIDLYPAWRVVVGLDRDHLARAGLDVPVLAVSSTLRIEALLRNDAELNDESSFPALIDVLWEQQATAHSTLRRQVRDELLGICDHLQSLFDAELLAITDPEESAAMVQRLEATKQRADELRSRSARWSTLLHDGVADLTSDVDFDFRQRIRRVTQDADEAIDAADPVDIWDEFEPWLVSRLSDEIIANYRYLTDRASALSVEVGALFDVDGAELAEELAVATPTEALRGIGFGLDAELRRAGALSQGFTILRGSYSGVLMFTMLGSMVGITLGPIAAGIGLLMGRKGLKDEKERQLAGRRTQARNAVRRYTDEVSFQLGKDSRDSLRRVQRQLRDHYTERAEALHRSTSEALRASTEAANADATQRDARAADARAELARIATLRQRVVALEPEGMA